MKIKEIQFKNHPILQDLNLNFCDVNGSAYDTIILAGENGAGKSTILNVILKMFENRFFPNDYGPEEERSIVIELNDEDIDILRQTPNGTGVFTLDNYYYREMTLKIDPKKLRTHGWLSIATSFIGTGDIEQREIFSQSETNQVFRSIFSDIDVNYTPENISTVTSLNLDQHEAYTYRSNRNLGTEIAQLLVDIQALDASEFATWAMDNFDKKVSDGVIDPRMRRFKEAFDYMFPNKRYKKIDTYSGSKKIVFEEFGKEIFLEELSSGEKQIVFRGSFLLRNKAATNGAIVLIDEPEISLHPKWQMKILDFYKHLFTNEEGLQTSQIIVATHSPFVIHNENRKMDKIIILDKNEQGIFVEKEPAFYGWTPKEAIIQAFDVNLEKDNEETIIFVEGPTDEKYLQKAIELFENQLPINIQWIGRRSNQGDKFTGDTALNQTKEYLLANYNLYRNKFVLLYDSDTNTRSQNYPQENLFIRKCPLNEENTLFLKGIENLLSLPDDFNREDFIDVKVLEDGYGNKTIKETLNKIKLCDWICDSLTPDQQRTYLRNFESLVLPILKSI